MVRLGQFMRHTPALDLVSEFAACAKVIDERQVTVDRGFSGSRSNRTLAYGK